MLLLGDTSRAGKLISKMGLQAILNRKFVSECKELLAESQDTESQELLPTQAELALKRHRTRKLQESSCSASELQSSFSENRVRYITVRQGKLPHSAMEGEKYRKLTSDYTTYEDALCQVEKAAKRVESKKDRLDAIADRLHIQNQYLYLYMKEVEDIAKKIFSLTCKTD